MELTSLIVMSLLMITALRNGMAQNDIKCLVCEQVVNEITSSVRKEDPRKMVQVGSFRIEPDGSQKRSEIKYAGSEIHLNDILETVCDTFDDYAQAKHKETGKLALLNLSKDIEKLSTYELVPDTDLNRSLKFHCENFVGEYEDDIIAALKGTSKFSDYEAKLQLCKTISAYCSTIYPSDVDRDEL